MTYMWVFPYRLVPTQELLTKQLATKRLDWKSTFQKYS